jgi:hypothetical protein
MRRRIHAIWGGGYMYLDHIHSPSPTYDSHSSSGIVFGTASMSLVGTHSHSKNKKVNFLVALCVVMSLYILTFENVWP